MKITNKIESYNKIIELNLNRFPEKVFKKGEVDTVIEFINQYPAKFYAIRDKSKAGGVFKLKVESQDILQEISDYDLFSINVSSFNYIDNQKLVGEILITKSSVGAILALNPKYSVRDALRDPDFNFTTSIFNNELLNQIPHFDDIYKFIVENNLIGVIVEFAYFDKPVGINNQNIIIYELRTDY